MKYKTIGLNLDRDFRNDLNQNFSDIDNDVKKVDNDIKTVDNRVSNIVAQAGNDNTEIVDARGGAPVLRDRLDDVDAQLAETVNNFKSKIENENVELGNELLNSTGWTSAGWTGDFLTGFTHIVGQTFPLSKSVPNTESKLFKVELTLTPTCVADNGQSDFWISLGGSVQFETYRGYSPSKTYVFGIRAINNDGLVITPWSGYQGTITNISIKEIIGSAKPTMTIKDSTGKNSLEVRPYLESQNNIFMGKNSGLTNISGSENTAIGVNSLRNNTSGFWNSALGYDTLRNNTVGSRNIAIGYIALQYNISGHRNIAIGSFSLHSNTHGANNVSVGVDNLQWNTTGNHNIALGTVAMGTNTTGSSNIAFGQQVMVTNKTGNYNIAIGELALGVQSTGDSNIALGYCAAHKQNGVSENIAIGSRALYQNTGGSGNVALGTGAGRGSAAGTYSSGVYIGYRAGYNLTQGSNNNVLIGYMAGLNATSGNNVLIGYQAGDNITTGSGNILIGYNLDTPTPTTSNHLNIGGVLFGDLNLQRIGIRKTEPTAILHLPANTAGTAALKMDAGTLMTSIQAGSIEFDGNDLYITTSANVRKKITAVAV